jgi:hypothetical protein
MAHRLLHKYSLIAPCGMNCGICMAYLREKNTCTGCRGVNTYKPVTRVRCKIKNCKTFRDDKVKFCFECGNFPCDVLKHLDTRYRTKYNMSMIENLENIRDDGIRKFIKNEDVRWTCTNCGGKICVHKGFCIECGKKK